MAEDELLTLRGFQEVIEKTFGKKDSDRGVAPTFMWFAEEVGELARALKRGQTDRENLKEEFSDVLAWLCTLASLVDIDMEEAARRYAGGCPRCKGIPCHCGEHTRFQSLPGERGPQ